MKKEQYEKILSEYKEPLIKKKGIKNVKDMEEFDKEFQKYSRQKQINLYTKRDIVHYNKR